jgi:hypothetical protein
MILHPPVKRARLDQQQLPARDNLHEGLHEAFEVRDADAERRCGLSPCEEPSRYSLDRPITRPSRHPGTLLSGGMTTPAKALGQSTARTHEPRELGLPVAQAAPHASAHSRFASPASPGPPVTRSHDAKMRTYPLHAESVATFRRGAYLLLSQLDPRNWLHRCGGAALRGCRPGPHATRCPSELARRSG